MPPDVTLQGAIDLIARTGFLLFFALWTVWRLDGYMARILEELHHQCEELARQNALLEIVVSGQREAARVLERAKP